MLSCLILNPEKPNNMKTTIISACSLLLLTLFVFSCTNNSKKEINTLVDTFYKKYQLDRTTIDKTLLTENLSKLIVDAENKEKAETELVAHSKFPTDKPLILEGDIFTSLYEGQNSFKINEIKIDGNNATVKIQFTNTFNKLIWEDQILLIKEKGWKIDNVLFTGHKNYGENTKNLLLHYLHTDIRRHGGD